MPTLLERMQQLRQQGTSPVTPGFPAAHAAATYDTIAPNLRSDLGRTFLREVFNALENARNLEESSRSLIDRLAASETPADLLEGASIAERLGYWKPSMLEKALALYRRALSILETKDPSSPLIPTLRAELASANRQPPKMADPASAKIARKLLFDSNGRLRSDPPPEMQMIQRQIDSVLEESKGEIDAAKQEARNISDRRFLHCFDKDLKRLGVPGELREILGTRRYDWDGTSYEDENAALRKAEIRQDHHDSLKDRLTFLLNKVRRRPLGDIRRSAAVSLVRSGEREPSLVGRLLDDLEVTGDFSLAAEIAKCAGSEKMVETYRQAALARDCAVFGRDESELADFVAAAQELNLPLDGMENGASHSQSPGLTQALEALVAMKAGHFDDEFFETQRPDGRVLQLVPCINDRILVHGASDSRSEIEVSVAQAEALVRAFFEERS